MQIALIAVAAGLLVRRGVVSQEQINQLSAFSVRILLPCLIFAKTLRSFDPSALPVWLWTLIPISGIVMMLLGLGLAYLLFLREMPAKKSMLTLACMQNGAYLVLPIGQVVYPDQFDRFALFCFLFIIGQGAIIWSIGKYLISSKTDASVRLTWRTLITPPFTANIVALTTVLIGLDRWLPAMMLDSVDFLGSATIPVATFILGATLGSISLRAWPPLLDLVRVLGVKFVLLPAGTIALLLVLGFQNRFDLLTDLVVIQSASAPATALILIVRTYGGDHQEIGSVMLVSYMICLFAIPFWLALWHIL